MRNKRFYTILCLIFLVLGVEFFITKQATPQRSQSTIPVVGILQFTSHPALDEIKKGVVAGLAKSGFREGETVKLEFQNGQGDQSKLTTMSQQLLQKKANVLVGIATPAAQALANETKKTPIVLGAITNPESAGLVASNQKPGGNITGVSDQVPIEAQLDLVQSLLPTAKKIGVLYSSAEDNSQEQVKQVKQAAQKRHLTIKEYAVPSSNEIASMVQKMTTEVDVVYLPTDNTIANAMETIANICQNRQMPIIPSVESMVEQGGLATVGLNQYELGVKTGEMVAEILQKKCEPSTTPIYHYKEGQLIVNQERLEALQIKIDDELTAKAKFVNQEGKQ